MKQQSWKMYVEDVHNCHSLREMSFTKFFLAILHFLMESYGNVLILKSTWSCIKCYFLCREGLQCSLLASRSV